MRRSATGDPPGPRRAGRRAIVRGATIGALLLLIPRTVSADDHEPWRKLIPRLPPAPSLPGPTPPDAEPDLEAFIRLCRATAARLARADGWVMPSGWYPMLFTRDAFWITAAHGDPSVHAAVLSRLGAEQHASGQIPTALYIDGYHPPGRDNADESTHFYVLMALDAFRLGLKPDRGALTRAGAYLASNAPGGRHQSRPGRNAYWLDTLALAGDAPCVAYVQGLHAVALRALREMGVPGAPPEPAEEWYRALDDPDLGQVRCYADRERRFGALRDVSALAGEALSRVYFGRPILEPSSVAGTLALQPRAYYDDGAFLGFKNLTQADGSALPRAWMSDWEANTPGGYQNGASWLLWDALALYAGIRHGLPASSDLLRARLASETRQSPLLHEYLSTAAEDPGASDSRRDGYGWNGFVARLIGNSQP